MIMPKQFAYEIRDIGAWYWCVPEVHAFPSELATITEFLDDIII